MTELSSKSMPDGTACERGGQAEQVQNSCHSYPWMMSRGWLESIPEIEKSY